MKKLALLASLLGMTQFASAYSLFCYEHPYQVVLSDDARTATVSVNDVQVPFGFLTCMPGGYQAPEFCYSAQGVRDAGYKAFFRRDPASGVILVDLSQTSFVGSRPLATLPCNWQ